MEPRIQYAKTSDGVSIAFCIMGEGAPVVLMAGWPFCHLQAEWMVPSYRLYHERLAAGARVIRYDPRGCGMSQRDVADLSAEGRVRDLEAVLGHARVDAFDIVSWGVGSQAAVLLASRQPEQLRHLVLWDTAPRSPDHYRVPQMDGFIALASTDWEMLTETAAAVYFGWSQGDETRKFAAYLRECVTQADALRAFEASANRDLTPLLPKIAVPTLVLRHHEQFFPSMEMAAELTSAIPGAAMATLEGRWITTDQRAEAAARAMSEFIHEGHHEQQTGGVGMQLPSGTAIILFADIVDSIALTERLGDAAFRQKARELDGSLRSLISENGGTPVEGKLLGDGVLAVFTSARQAIDVALRCGKAGSHGGLPLHLGIHAGDVIREEGNVYGGAVNIASRISGLSAPGEVLVSDTVRGLARTSAGVSFEDRGEQTLKGVSEPVRLFAVREREDG
ncbi:MAG: adenylate/guanylate cyclase domain-containing protein [Chloroflexi bacterium]|nr:adenylate/guanylate cyclase domain-containing protein [Chloroflexota bacterium]